MQTVQDILAKLPALNNRDYFLALDELQRLLLAQQTDVLTDDDIEQLSKIDIDDTQDMGQGARKRTAKDWLKDHLLGKTVRTIDGKIVHFNSEDTVGHISFNVRRNATLVQCMPFIPQVFAKGEFVGREHSEHTRADDSIIAFHLYQKWIKLKNGYQVYAQVQACERKNQQGLFYAGYNLKALDKKRTIFDNMVLGVATPSHQNGNSDSTTLANAQATTTLGKKSTTQFDKLQDDTSNHVLPLLILMIKDEMGRVVFDLENGIDEIDDRLAFQAIQSPVFVREGLKPTNKDGKVTASARQKANNEAIALLDKIESEGLTRDDLTAEQLETLAKYTGNGGGIVNHEGKTGSQDELQRLLLAQQTDVLTDDDIEQLSKIDIDDTQDMGQGARKRTAKDWIRDNLLGKTVKTIDGKVVHFNSKDTIGHITYNVKRNDILVKCLPYIPQIFAKGEFMGRELSDHDRADKSIIAFHPYRKWVELKNGYKVFAEVQACERENESDLFYAGYNLKALKKVASPSHFDSVMDNTKWLSLGFMATFNGNNSPQFDKLQDDITTNDVLPLLILMLTSSPPYRSGIPDIATENFLIQRDLLMQTNYTRLTLHGFHATKD